ncbi:MAG: FAD-dependent monooxygenase [Hyphomicrobiaceae bacterium]
MANIRAIVIGGGIGGTAAAIALARRGIEVDVYEQAAQQAEVGAGIQISPNASRLLYRYGLKEMIEACAVRPKAIERRRWQDGRVLSRAVMGEAIETAFAAPYYHVHRADLLAVLANALEPGRVHTGKRCIAVSQDEHGATAHFEDGTKATGDVIVGADGIHSAVRTALLGAERPRFSGHVAYRGLAPVERPPTSTCSAPAPHGWALAAISFTTRLQRTLFELCRRDRGRHLDEGIMDGQRPPRRRAPGFRRMHDQVHHHDVDQTIAALDRDPLLQKWSVGRITPLGDACHAMRAAVHGPGRSPVHRGRRHTCSLSGRL